MPRLTKKQGVTLAGPPLYRRRIVVVPFEQVFVRPGDRVKLERELPDGWPSREGISEGRARKFWLERIVAPAESPFVPIAIWLDDVSQDFTTIRRDVVMGHEFSHGPVAARVGQKIRIDALNADTVERQIRFMLMATAETDEVLR